ncbi:MAG: hypothetical protein GAK37_03640 [Pseudomonas sp.]|nr:MAG: hypothetical protein GAK37_03640 [Pseudomonas sp.]
MTVFLLLYLCADATRTDCQVILVQRWQGIGAYAHCIHAIPGLTKALTVPNRKRHRFICEVEAEEARQSELKAARPIPHQSLRM